MFAFVGDLHLGAHSERLPNLYKKQLKTLQGIVDTARSKGLDRMVLAGDVFDSATPANRYIIAFLNFLYKNNDMFFDILMGNHDWDSIERSALDIPHFLGNLDGTNYKVHKEPSVEEIAGVRVFMCPHPHLIDMPKDVDWAIGHFAWNGAVADNGRLIKSDKQPKGRWLLGDFHTPQEGKRFVYAGSVTQISQMESTEKSWLLVDESMYRRITHKLAYKFKVAKASNDDDLIEVSNDRKTYWFLQTLDGYVLPDKFVENNPHVISIRHARSKKQDIRAAVLLANVGSNTINRPTAALSTFLEKRGDLDKKTRSAVMKLAERVFADAGLGNG